MGKSFIAKHETAAVTLMVIGAFLLSLAHSFYFSLPPYADAKSYHTIATNLAGGFGYRESKELPLGDPSDNAIGRIGPGYEFFLAFVYAVFGPRYQVVWAMQALLHALTALFVFLIGRLLFGSAPALLGALAFATYPDLVLASSMLLTENVGIFLMTAFVYVFFLYKKELSWRFAFLFSLLFVPAFLVRTGVALMILPYFFLAALNRRWGHGLLFVAILCLFITPWALRNYRVYHAFIPTSLTLGLDLHAGNNPLASGELDESRNIDHSEYRAYDYVRGDRAYAKAAVLFIATHPFSFVKLTLYRISMYFSFIRPTGWWPYLSGSSWQPFILAASAMYSVVVFTFGFFGMWEAVRNADEIIRANAKWLFGFLIAVVLPVIFIIVETRYRYSSYPLFAVFAGYGAWALAQKRKEVMKTFFVVSGVLWLNAAFDVARNFSRIMERIAHL